MADTIQKRVVVDGDVSGMVSSLDRLADSGNSLYTRLKKEAEEYSDNLKVQATYIDKLISLEQKRAVEYNKQINSQFETRKEEMLSADSSVRGRRTADKEYEDQVSKQKRYHSIEMQEILQAKQASDMDYGSVRGRRVSDFNNNEPEPEANPNDPRFRRSVSRAGRFVAGAGTAMMAGLGIGFAFGIFGILFEMVKSANELDKSMTHLKSTMGGVSKESLFAASSIGKTAAEMAELVRRTAISSGGTVGGTGTLRMAQFAKAFGIDENLLIGQMGTGRMMSDGGDMNKELLVLLREMLKTGTVSSTNMAKLTEKIEYWSRLNQMQSEQLLTVSPTSSSFVLAAFEQTGMPILSDQRQIEFIEKLNRGMTSPGNEFVRAYNMNALSQLTGGNLLQSLILEEQGIFGKGVLRAYFDQFQGDFGDKGKDTFALGLHGRFPGISYQESEMLYQNLFAPGKEADREKFLTILEAMGSTKDNNEYNAMAKELADKYGLNVQTRAPEMTAQTDVIKAQMTNIMAGSGMPMLKELQKIIGNSDLQQSLSLFTSGIGIIAATILEKAAPILLEGAKIFNWGVKEFAKFFGAENFDEETIAIRKETAKDAYTDAKEIFDDTKTYPGRDPQLKKNFKEILDKYLSSKDSFMSVEEWDDLIRQLQAYAKAWMIDNKPDPNYGKNSNPEMTPEEKQDYFFQNQKRREDRKGGAIEMTPEEKQEWLKKHLDRKNNRDQSSIDLDGSIKDLTKAIQDNVYEAKRNHFKMPGVYTEEQLG